MVMKTPFTRIQVVAGLVAIAGVILITQPFSLVNSLVESSQHGESTNSSMITAHSNTTVGEEVPDSFAQPTPTQRAIAVACGVMGICGAASAYVTISWIGKRAHPLISVTYFSGWCTFVSIIAMLFVPSVGFRMPATVREWSLLTGLGISGFVMQFLLTASLAHRRSNRVLNMVYSQMLFALGFDKLLFDEIPTLLSWLGSGLILGSVFYVAIKTDNEKKEIVVGEPARGSNTGDEEAGLMAGMEPQEVDYDLPTSQSTGPAMEMRNMPSDSIR